MKPMKTMRLAALSLALLGGAEAALASEVTITAEYRPSSTNTRFKNTTPLGGFCRLWPNSVPCRESAESGSVALNVEYTKKSTSWDPVMQNRYWVKFPVPRAFDVTGPDGSAHSLLFKVTTYGSILHKLAGSSGDFPNKGFTYFGCSASEGAIGNVYWVARLLAINNPDSPEGCVVSDTRVPAGLDFFADVRDFSIGYALTTPNPLAMRAGLYTGEINYSVGENGDIALGNNITNLSTNSLKIKFELDVQHAFELQFPANSDKVILEPPGGWMRWLNGGPAPEKLVRDLPFRITKTGPMSIFMECEYEVGRLCGVRNPRNNHTAALEIKMSLPGGLQLHNGQAVERHPIPTGRTMPLRVETETPVFNQPGALHFATAPGEAAAMVQHPGDTYRGNVTVVFDALL